MTNLLLIILLSTAFYYLGSRAKLTEMLWSRYPPRMAAFMDCAACTGFWWGVIFSTRFEPLPFGLPPNLHSYGVIGLVSIVLTPIVAGFMQQGLDSLGVINTEES